MIKSKLSKGFLSILFLMTFVWIGLGQITVHGMETEGVNNVLKSLRIHYVSTFDELRDAITGAPTNGEDVVIEIQEDIVFTATINITSGKNITIQSNEEQIATLSRNSGRHFTLSGVLTLKNITLDGEDTGGGIQVNDTNAQLIMENGAMIQNCRGTTAGGVLLSNGTLTMLGGVIERNEATGVNGAAGGVLINHPNAILHLEAGMIKENKAKNREGFTVYPGNGGGVNVVQGTFVMLGGSIERNEADRVFNAGGGVHVHHVDAIFEMRDGVIKENMVGGVSGGLKAGGVYVNQGTVRMLGGRIEENISTTQISAGGVYLDSITASFEMKDGAIIGNQGMSNMGNDVGGVEIRNGLFTMSGGSIEKNEGDNGGFRIRQGTLTILDGNIKQNKARAGWWTGAGISIEDRGHVSMTGGSIEENEGGIGAVQLYHEDATFDLEAGMIKNNRTTTGQSGGGVQINRGGTFTMSGGTIAGNEITAANGGGGIHILNGNFFMFGGNIEGNLAPSGGGIRIANSGRAILNKGIISRNTATNNGGGIFANLLNEDNIIVNSEVIFSENSARSIWVPPHNVNSKFPNIKTSSGSIDGIWHPINNYDIGFTTSNPSIRTLTVLSNIENGGVIKVAGLENLREVGVFEGEDVLLEAITASGYQFTGWTSSNGGTFADATSPNTTFAMPNSDTTITANFEEISELTFLDFFPDENLAQVVASRFSRQVTNEVTEEELNSLTGIISGNYRGISNLEGIQHLTGISHLYLMGNKLINESLEPLTQLPNLMMLFLDDNQITDLSIFTNSINPLFTISATNQNIILDPINEGDITEGIYIRSRYGQVPAILNFNPIGGIYEIENGMITWAGIGENTLTWSDDHNFSGTITQVVNPS